MAGQTLRDQIRQLVGLERRDRGGDDVDRDGGGHHRDRDVFQLLRGGCAVDGSGLIHFLRDRLQAGQEDHHAKANLDPGRADDDGNIRNAARLQPVDGRQARGSNDLVDNAVVVVVHDAPQNADDRAGQQRREEPQRAHQPAGQTVSAALIERERRQERDDDGDRGHADGEGHGGKHHFAEALDLMQVHVVVQADEVVGLGKSVPVGETVADDIDQGNDHKDRAEHQRRQDKEDTGGPLIALKLREPSSAGRTFHRIPLFSGLRWVTRMG